MECEEPVDDTVCLDRKKGEINLYKDNEKKEIPERGYSLEFLM